MRPTELYPRILVEELLRLGRLRRDWLWVVLVDEGHNYKVYPRYATWTLKMWRSGADALGLYAGSRWLLDGPKVFRPSPTQVEALEHVKINLTLGDYAQPFPVLVVQVDLPPFKAVTCLNEVYPAEGGPLRLLVCTLHSVDGLSDIVTVVSPNHGTIEDSITKFDEDCRGTAPAAVRALRIALNSCLCLCDRALRLAYLFPKEVERDRRTVAKGNAHAAAARERLTLAPQILAFEQEVRLHAIERRRSDGPPTGRELTTHWRLGHWAMQPCGPGGAQRKRILRPSVLVRADRFDGDPSDTRAVYRG